MVIGQLRNVDDATVAVDVILNKSVIESCLNSKSEDIASTFKHQIIELASNWIEADTGVVFSRLWTPCADHYSGTVPTLFTHAAQHRSLRQAQLNLAAMSDIIVLLHTPNNCLCVVRCALVRTESVKNILHHVTSIS